MIGLSVDLIQLADFWPAILWAVIAVYIARAVSVYVLVPFTTRSFSLAKITWVERHIMWWGGLKGGAGNCYWSFQTAWQKSLYWRA